MGIAVVYREKMVLSRVIYKAGNESDVPGPR